LKIEFCSLYSGSSGNCQFVKTEKTNILVDAGLSGKKIQQEMIKIGEDPKKIDAIFITHEHLDHVQGAGILSRRFDIPIYANERTWDAMNGTIGDVKSHNIKIITEDVEVGDIFIQPFDISHDAANPVGYNIYYKNKKISMVTDTGCINANIIIN